MGRSTLDLYFYSDPVAPGETATFTVYTDNTAVPNAWFGVCYWPTPVPEPTGLLLLPRWPVGDPAAQVILPPNTTNSR